MPPTSSIPSPSPLRRPASVGASLATALAGGALAVVGPVPGAQAAVSPTPACTATTCTVTFGVTGAPASFEVPAGISSVRMTVRGAQGGTQYGVPGGAGGEVAGTLAVGAGDTFAVIVGQAGTSGGGATYGGGGAAGNNATSGSGGGGTYVFAADDSPVLVAGGGGGANSLAHIAGNPAGGSGGGDGAGGDGPSRVGGTATAATAGTSSAVGRGGTTPSDQPSTGNVPTAGLDGTALTAGTPGSGGAGNPNNDIYTNPVYNGAGGGGGYYGGGGGGARQGGAGGSGYISSQVTSTTSSPGAWNGDGQVVVGWDRATTTTSLGVSPAGQHVVGDSITLAATVASSAGTASGTVDFTDGATAVSGCQDVALSAGTATCSTTPTAGSHSFGATYDPGTSYGYGASSATPVQRTVIAPARITTTSVPAATVGQAYSQQLVATDGTAPYVWSLSSGTLPDGLTLSPGGLLSGTPTIDGSSAVTVAVSDSGTTQTGDTQDLTVVVGPGTFTVGAPTIAGSARVGETLTCAAPAGPGSRAYTWVRGTGVVGQGATYALTPDDLGATLTCRVRVTRAGYGDATSSATTGTVSRGTSSIAAPTITGRPVVGQELSCAAPAGTPGTLAYAWSAGGTPVASGATLTPRATEIGATLTCTLTSSRPGFEDATSSTTTAPVAAAPGAPVTVTVAGVAKTERTLVATVGAAPAGAAVTLQWYADGTAVPDATRRWFRPSTAQLGARITVTASVVETGRETVVVRSAATRRVVQRALGFSVDTRTVAAGRTVEFSAAHLLPRQRWWLGFADGTVLASGRTADGTTTLAGEVRIASAPGRRVLVLRTEGPVRQRSTTIRVR